MWSKGICWIDDCRIPFIDGDTTSAGKRTCNIFETEYKSGGNGSPDYITDSRGRFPANILVCDDMLNDGVISGQNKEWMNQKINQNSKIYGSGKGLPAQITKIKTDKGTNSRYYDIDKWFEKILNYE